MIVELLAVAILGASQEGKDGRQYNSRRNISALHARNADNRPYSERMKNSKYKKPDIKF